MEEWLERGCVMHVDYRALLLSALRWIGPVLLVVAVLPLLCFEVSHAQQAAQSHNLRPLTVDPNVLAVEQSILNNIKQNGFDANPKINNGLGGLWLNWLYGSNPLQTNFNGSGKPDGPKIVPPRHDMLTDLRYLHALWLYKSQNPTDTQYDSEVAKYTAIVKAEFTSSGNTRGWLVDEEFIDLYHLSNDPFYQSAAVSLVTHYAKSIDPKVGITYQTNSAHPYGYYRPDWALEQGCALIQLGTEMANATWVTQGQAMINFVYSHAYIAQYHTFPDQLDRVLLPGGGVNPSETFYVDKFRNYIVHGNLMKVGSIAQIIISLLHTYQITQNTDFLNKALDLLNPLSLPANTLGMWDTTYLGYYYQLQFSGTGPQQPGTITVDMDKKEAGRQEEMLWAFHLADQLTNGQYANMEALMKTVALTKAYYAPGHGVLDEVTRQWTLLTVGGRPENWVTSEAMGIELEALLDLYRTTPY